MREKQFAAQLNLRIRQSDKADLEQIGRNLDLEPSQIGRIALREGVRVIRERGIQPEKREEAEAN
jgi:hypothetical protein